jgi:hypothetical protein
MGLGGNPDLRVTAWAFPGGAAPRSPASTSDLSPRVLAIRLAGMGGRARAEGSPEWSYVILTFQKSGAGNLRMPWTLFRKAVGWNHLPHGTYVTSSRATL